MQMLAMGGNAPVPAPRFDLVITWPTPAGSLDPSTYLLRSDGKVRGDEDMIFYNQRSDANRSVHLAEAREGYALLSVDLDRVPDDVARIVVCVTIDEPGRTMSAFQGTSASLRTENGETIRFQPQLDGASEVAMRLVALYRRNGVWKLRADGQGYKGGLAPLARSFGIDVAEDEAAPAKPTDGADAPPPSRSAPSGEDGRIEFAVAAPVRSTPSSPPGDGSLPLSEERPKARWNSAQQDEIGEIAATLEWRGQIGGMQGRPRAFQPALGCFYELADGRKGLVQNWDDHGQLDAAPFIHLGSVRPDGARGEQKLRVNGSRWPLLRSITLFAHLQADAPNWHASSMRLTLAAPGETPLSLSNDGGPDGKAAIALVRLVNRADGVEIERLMRFAEGHRELDLDLGWGLRWNTWYPSH